MSKKRVVYVPATYVTDCLRRVVDKETGAPRIARMREERPVSATLYKHGKRVFFRGAVVEG